MSQLRGERFALLAPYSLGALLHLRADGLHLLVDLGARNLAVERNLFKQFVARFFLAQKTQLHG